MKSLINGNFVTINFKTMNINELIKKILYDKYFETDILNVLDKDEVKRFELLSASIPSFFFILQSINLEHNKARIEILQDILNEEINKLIILCTPK